MQAISGTMQVPRNPVRTGQCHSQELCRQLLSSSHNEPLELAWRHPREVYGRRPSARSGRRHNTDYAEHVLSTTTGTVRPSSTLWSHPRRYGALC
jgi:hypothetical protein